MRFRRIAAATFLALQALVAVRPFVALSPDATSPAAHPGAIAAHATAGEARDDCHGAHAPAETVSNGHHAASSGAPSEQPTAPAPHDHGDSACHAGTPCCAPTLPMAPLMVPVTQVVFASSSPTVHAVSLRAEHVARRLPPATAPPARI